jgi:hypothetical protein
MSKAETEYCVLTIAPHGDVVDVDGGNTTLKEAKLRMELCPKLNRGWLYTIEGRRYTPDGRTLYKRTGVMRGYDVANFIRATWDVVDAKWYRSGDEPDFAIRY